jgi:glycosyltransferase involved in cell wall biosynthesis
VGDGPERLRLEQQAARLGVADFVHLAGEQPVAAYLSAMDLLVSPSRYETFGLAVLEGLASGLVVRYRSCPALDDLGTAVPGAAALPDDDGELPEAVDRALAGLGPGRRCPDELGMLRIDVVAARIDALHEEVAGQRDPRNS